MAAPDSIRPLGSKPANFAASFDPLDASLFREAERGNGAAFERIAARYHHAILALLLALTGSEQVALDLCHATLLTAYREMPRRRAPSMYVWFYRLASHQWLAWAGHHAGHTRADAALSARERLVFALKTQQRLALYTAAQVLDLPEETVSRIFTRAVAKLRLPPR